MLSKRITSIAGSKGALSTFSTPFSTGGIFGFYASGTSAAAAGKLLEAAVDELKLIAGGSGAIDAFKNKVRSCIYKRNNQKSLIILNFEQVALEFQLAIESELATSVIVGATQQNIPLKNDFKGISSASVSAAASNALKSVPAYAVLGTTYGAPTFNQISSMIK